MKIKISSVVIVIFSLLQMAHHSLITKIPSYWSDSLHIYHFPSLLQILLWLSMEWYYLL